MLFGESTEFGQDDLSRGLERRRAERTAGTPGQRKRAIQARRSDKRLSARRRPVSSAMETLEARTFLSVNLSNSPDVAAAVQAASDLSIYSASQLSQTHSWVVGYAEGASPSQMAAAIGATDTGPTGLIDNTDIFSFPNGVSAATASSALKNLAGEQFAFPIVPQAAQLYSFPGTPPNDPLYPQQWNLNNTGQTGGTKGADINVQGAWQEGYTGKGVVTGVVDSGIYYPNPDLTANYRPDLSYNFFNDTLDAKPPLDALLLPFSPGAPSGENSHGTEVAGIIAAVANNGIGVAGIAPDSQVSSLRLITEDPSGSLVQGGDSQSAQALTFDNQKIDIYNNSWGYIPQNFIQSGILGPPDPLTLAAMKTGVTTGRGGLGNIYVFAAGNSGNQAGFENSNNEAETASRYAITVAALDDNGKQTLYSDSGASVLVSAPGGKDYVGAPDEHGLPSTSVIGTTPDAQGNPTKYESTYDDSGPFGMNGTSAATPGVSGVIALMLQANPKLSWRDVQEILAETSTQTDPKDTGWMTNGYGYTSDGAIVPVAADGTTSVALPAGVTVSPFHVDDKYGFGLVNATAAVNMAKTWTPMLPEQMVTSGVVVPRTTAIPDGVAEGISSSVTFTGNLHVEHAEVVLNITHPQRGDIEVILTAPNGTRTILQTTRSFETPQGDTSYDVSFDANGKLVPNADYNNWATSSVQDWGVSATGTWTLSVSDRDANGQVGTFDSWKLNLYGTQDYAPIAQDITTSTTQNQATTVDLLGHTYDTDGSVQVGTLAIQANPQHGSVTINPQTGQAVYTPAPNFSGTDSFTYTIKDDQGAISRTATVTVAVGFVHQPPVAANDAAVALQGNPVAIDILANDTDATDAIVPSSVVIVTQPAEGTVQVNQTTGAVTYTPGPNFASTDTFQYTVGNTAGETSNVATVTIGATDVAPVAVDDVVPAFDKNSTVPISVLTNDTDAGSGIDPSTVQIVTQPQNGVLSVDPVSGLVSYTPAPNFFGNDGFSYTVRDHLGVTSNVANVSLTVLPTGAPMALDHEFVLVPNFNTVAGIRAIDNPTNSGTLIAKLVTPPAHGSLVLNADGTFTYNQFAGFPGLDSFTYQVNDGSQDSNVATIRLVSPQFHYIEKLYHDVLNRTAADGDIMYWVNRDPNGVNRAATAEVFVNSDEYRSNEINSAYQQLLGRALDPGGQIYWLGQMRAGLPIEAVMASITGAPEYAAAHGGTAAGVVAGLYQDLLGRGASANDIAYWTGQMSRGLSTPAIAMAFMGTTEYRTDLISGYYQTYLHHVPDQAGLRNWLNLLASGFPRTSVQAGILASSEYFTAL